MSNLYDFRQTKVTTAGGVGADTLLFAPNIRRMSLTISCSDTRTGGVVSVGLATGQLNLFAVFSTPGSIILPYRDLGLLIRQSIYVGFSAFPPGGVVVGAEVFAVN